MAIATLLLLGVSGAAAQSLGDYARSVRKNKPEPTVASRHYDNDNLPTTDKLSVVGPPPSNDTGAATAKAAAAPGPSAQQKAADEWKQKLDDQKQKVDALNHELDLDQREVRLRTAAAYTDPTVAVRDVQWNKDDARYKSQIEQKQKALDDARQQLEDMQEQAHKAGVAPSDKDNTSDANKDKDNNKQ
jgi:hypothetical protein